MIVGDPLWWLPTAGVVAAGAIGFAASVLQPWRPARKYWVAAVLAVGLLAAGASVRLQARDHAALLAAAARSQYLESRIERLGQMLPAGLGQTPGDTADRVAAGIDALNKQAVDLAARIDALRQKTRMRTIDPDTAARMADYLRRFGSQRAVVSCVPDDVEAYAYANQIANVLRAAGWEALGPEKTTIFGTAPRMDVRLFVRNTAGPPDTAHILIDAFTRFNIPFESGLAPSEAIPDPATIEIFVSRKP